MKEFHKGRKDEVFKALLADPEDPFLLKTLLELILNKEVHNIQFHNAELLKRSVLERAKLTDLTVTVDGCKIQLEMNSAFKDFIHFRNFNYFTTIINQHDRMGEEIDYTYPFLHIDFTYGLDTSLPFDSEYKICSRSLTTYIDNVTLREFNMDYITKSWYYVVDEREKKLYKYLSLFDMNEEELKALPKGEDQFMDQFQEKVIELNHNDEFTSWLTREEDIKKVHATEMKIAKESGIAAGKEEGIQENKIEIAKKMLQENIETSTISKVTGLTLEEIDALKNEEL